jgi:hypothetical protein
MDSQRRYSINRASVVFEAFDTEVVIINLDSGNYYSFEGVGTDVWAQIENNATISEIVERVSSRYDCSNPGDIENALDQSLAELEQEGLVIHEHADQSGSEKKHEVEVKTASDEQMPVFKKPKLSKYTDMQDFLLVDPIHEVDYTKWPEKK